MKDQTITVRNGDIDLAVRVAGTGPLVILMHGWPDLGLTWRHQVGPLLEAGFTVAVPDMRGFGGSSKPEEVTAYSLDRVADDMAEIARALDAQRWVAVGHDWGAAAAWRCALRFPDQVAAVFCISVTYDGTPPGHKPVPMRALLDLLYPDTFVYPRYFQEVGRPEAELERDVRDSLKRILFSLSGDAPRGDFAKRRPMTSGVLEGLTEPPPGPLSFITDEELDLYAAAFEAGGFFGPLSWYRNFETNARDAAGYGDATLHQPAGFLAGDSEIVTLMFPGALEAQRRVLADLRVETQVLGNAGHWIQQERPGLVTHALLGFLDDVQDHLGARGQQEGTSHQRE